MKHSLQSLAEKIKTLKNGGKTVHQVLGELKNELGEFRGELQAEKASRVWFEKRIEELFIKTDKDIKHLTAELSLHKHGSDLDKHLSAMQACDPLEVLEKELQMEKECRKHLRRLFDQHQAAHDAETQRSWNGTSQPFCPNCGKRISK